MDDPAPAYALDELGWLQFERLCSLVLTAETGLEPPRWTGHADRSRVGLLDGPVRLRGSGLTLRGPAAVAVVWVRADLSGEQRLAHLVAGASEVPGELGSWPEDVVVLTNLESDLARRALALRFGDPALTVDERLGGFTVLGAHELGAVIDREPVVRAALPSLLGLRDLAALLDAGVAARSAFDIDAARELARVFWPTRAYERACRVLEHHRFVVLTGPPEVGKTAIARMIALAALADGWEAHETSDPDQVWRAYDRDRRQVFVADDAFGSTEYRPDAAERWARELSRLLTLLDDRHWLIWTSRPAPLKAAMRRVQRERGAERFPAPGQILVDATDLDLAEKTLILFRHAKGRGVSRAARNYLRPAAVRIVENPHFTPERIRRLLGGPLEQLASMPSLRGGEADASRVFMRLIESELAAPTDSMRTSFRALSSEYRELLIALLDAPAGLIDERHLVALARRHHSGGLSRPPGELIDRLSDHFLRITPLGIDWVHPSWRDLVIGELRLDDDARLRFLSACELDGALLALSREGGAAGERSLPLLVTDADWDALGDRLTWLLPELEDQQLGRLLLGVAAAIGSENDPRTFAELDCLARSVLSACRRRWDQAHRVLPAFLIDAWYAANARLAEPMAAPALGLTWTELLPRAGTVTGRWLGADLAAVDEWLALAQTLAEYDPGALERLGFFAGEHERLHELARSLGRHCDPDARPLIESILARIRALDPECSEDAEQAARAVKFAALDEDRWWVPHDIAAPPSLEPVVAGQPGFTTRDVLRVMRDL